MSVIERTPITTITDRPGISRSDSTSYDPGEIIDEEKIPGLKPMERPPEDPDAPSRAVTKTSSPGHKPVPKVPLAQQQGQKTAQKQGVPAAAGDRATPEKKPLQRAPEAQKQPSAPPTPAPEDDLEAFMAMGERTVEKAETPPQLQLPQVKPTPRPLRFRSYDRRPIPATMVAVEPSAELLEMYRDATNAGQASAVWVGGVGETLGDYVYDLLRTTFPTRRYVRLPRLARFDSKVKFEYLWTGWGLLYQGTIRLVLFEMETSLENPQPRTVYLIDPQTLF